MGRIFESWYVHDNSDPFAEHPGITPPSRFQTLAPGFTLKGHEYDFQKGAILALSKQMWGFSPDGHLLSRDGRRYALGQYTTHDPHYQYIAKTQLQAGLSSSGQSLDFFRSRTCSFTMPTIYFKKTCFTLSRYVS